MKKIVIHLIFLLFVFNKAWTIDKVLVNYSNLAEAKYQDSLELAKKLEKDIKIFLNKPTLDKFEKVKESWLSARVVYQQTEVFRFGNPLVDDWEGKVNAWPLDEGLIDYVNITNYYPSENDFSNFNVIANKKLSVEGNYIDASVINANLLENELHEIGGNEANVATGYHAIEFLLWGQDLNGNKKGNGKRPYTDYSLKNCSNDNCDRRRKYLLAAVNLLVKDLEEIKLFWSIDGEARKNLVDDKKHGIKRILTGMGSLSYGELAGERMKLGLMLHDPEEEHDCFSDNTHNSHYYNVLGIKNIYLGNYKTISSKVISGESISSKVAMKDSKLDIEVKNSIDNTLLYMKKIVESAENGITYDMLIAEGNKIGNKMIQDAIDALVLQSKKIEQVAKLLNVTDLQVEGSDSLDNPEAVFN